AGVAQARAPGAARGSRRRYRRRPRPAGGGGRSSRRSPQMSALPNPLREGLAAERIPEPATMVIFGASGDLTKRKLLPALYSLTRERLLPGRFAVIGYARKQLTDDAFRAEMRAGCEEFARRRPVDAELWDGFARNIFYQEGAYDDPNAFLA